MSAKKNPTEMNLQELAKEINLCVGAVNFCLNKNMSDEDFGLIKMYIKSIGVLAQEIHTRKNI